MSQMKSSYGESDVQIGLGGPNGSAYYINDATSDNSYSTMSGNWTILMDTAGRYSFNSTMWDTYDWVGYVINSFYVDITNPKIDGNKPVINVNQSNNAWCKSLNLIVNVSDESAITHILLDGKSISNGGSVLINKNGIYSASATDSYGNTGTVTREITNIDSTLPVITAKIT